MEFIPSEGVSVFYLLAASLIGALGGGGIVASFFRYRTDHHKLSLEERRHIDKVAAELRQELLIENRLYRRQITLLARRVDLLEAILHANKIAFPPPADAERKD